MPEYYVTISTTVEISRCSLFTLTDTALQCGALILASINNHLIIGRWFPQLAGVSWILQPGRIIRITGAAAVKIIGILAPFEPFAIDYCKFFV